MNAGNTLPAGKPEKTEVRVGYLPLTDCAAVIVAAELGFDQRYGIRILPARAGSWAAVRDGLLTGELDAAHALYGLMYGVHLGLGGMQRDMAVLMTLNQNGQGITLAAQLAAEGVKSGDDLARRIRRDARRFTFAQTFPTGTHAMWLYYWLAALGIHPLRDVKSIVVPPPLMVAALRAGQMDGYCAGEPWHSLGAAEGVGFTIASSGDIWPDHPEKVLGATADWAAANPGTASALIAALLDASRFVDDVRNREQVAALLEEKGGLPLPAAVLNAGLSGTCVAGGLKCFDDGRVNYPYLSDGMWFLTQYRRWGLLPQEPDYLALARSINHVALYQQGAALAGVPLPASSMRSSRLMDGVVWDGRDPAGYAAGFAVQGAAAVARQ
ncbi:CmpA/NrtA family ABC transporter substrate-binding protein [Vogesella sp. LIG4]|uniref:CmpA/NrtA family ABC transporter substrate-binding protein n=1 Tax=Vogesella sp. LIG4 TaxID=1192162 RepID=UPI00081FAAA4|nr:CmpA/NrtA family ABC transporter substrate-binding protein [Vogesella sp. LIG4]SCK28664.1 nitrate/nitrite transport system substrate-binding protein [Vogesella sp. LIG4]